MNKLVTILGLAAVSASFGLIGACSSSSSSGGTTTGDGGSDGSSTTSDSGAGNDSGGNTDSGGGNPDDTCTAMATKTACEQCCGTHHTAGATVGANAAVACACHGTGTDAGAGGDAGAGPCAAACEATLCAATPATPDGTCQTCLQTQISTAAGECAQYFATTCQANADCAAEQTCFQGCPK